MPDMPSDRPKQSPQSQTAAAAAARDGAARGDPSRASSVALAAGEAGVSGAPAGEGDGVGASAGAARPRNAAAAATITAAAAKATTSGTMYMPDESVHA
jgi:hypothetical protein